MLRNLATALIEHKRIQTTEARAKELSRYVESLIEHAKKAKAATGAEALHHKRMVLSKIRSRRDPDSTPGRARSPHGLGVARDRTVANQLFDQVASRYLEAGKERKGGYTRITRLQNRKGDGALVVLVELV
jgi:large subunit ribosomal protein L17